MNLMKVIWAAIGGVSSSCLMSFIYLFTSHSAINEIKADIKEIHHYMKTIEKCVPHLDKLDKKHGK